MTVLGMTNALNAVMTVETTVQETTNPDARMNAQEMTVV
jgi:hypothetical protein